MSDLLEKAAAFPVCIRSASVTRAFCRQLLATLHCYMARVVAKLASVD